jgi:hypothetical protein
MAAILLSDQFIVEVHEIARHVSTPIVAFALVTGTVLEVERY